MKGNKLQVENKKAELKSSSKKTTSYNFEFKKEQSRLNKEKQLNWRKRSAK